MNFFQKKCYIYNTGIGMSISEQIFAFIKQGGNIEFAQLTDSENQDKKRKTTFADL